MVESTVVVEFGVALLSFLFIALLFYWLKTNVIRVENSHSYIEKKRMASLSAVEIPFKVKISEEFCNKKEEDCKFVFSFHILLYH